MSEFGPIESRPGQNGQGTSSTENTQAIPRFDPSNPYYQQGVSGAPLPVEAHQDERPVERTRPMRIISEDTLAPPAAMSYGSEASATGMLGNGQDVSPWNDTLTAANARLVGSDETSEQVFAIDVGNPRARTLGEKMLTRTVATVATVAFVAAVVLAAQEILRIGKDDHNNDDALPAPTAFPFLPSESASPSLTWSPSPSASRTMPAVPIPTKASPSPSKMSASPSASPSASESASPSPSLSASETATASASPSSEVNTCAASGSAASTAICMPRGGTAYAYEWPPAENKVVYSVTHGQVVSPECVNSSGWVLADYGDQAGYLQPNLFQQDDLRLISACAN